MRKIVFNVSSAKVVNTNLSKKDTKIYNGKEKETIRKDSDWIGKSLNDMENMIHINHIINALHVMVGSRPVSFKYGDRNKLSDRISNIVENGVIQYENIFRCKKTFKNSDTKTIFYNEFTQGKKPVKNSNRKVAIKASNGEVFNGYFTWSLLEKKSLHKEQWKECLDTIIEYGKYLGYSNLKEIKKEYTLLDLMVKLKTENPEWIEKFALIKDITEVNNFLENKKTQGSFNHISCDMAGLGNINAPTPKITLNAKIVLFMEDEDAEIFLNTKRYATILDNGFISIVNENDEYNPITNVRDLHFIDIEDIESYIEECIDEGYEKISNLPYTNKLCDLK